MRSTHLASSVGDVIFRFSPCFTVPTAEGFAAFVVGWLLCQGRHTVSGALIAARSYGLWSRHHSAFYGLLSRARWSADEVGHVLFEANSGYRRTRVRRRFGLQFSPQSSSSYRTAIVTPAWLDVLPTCTTTGTALAVWMPPGILTSIRTTPAIFLVEVKTAD